jgi:triosephosphate isomerase
MKRGFIIAGNWKMNKTAAESAAFVKELDGRIGPNEKIEVLIFPPSTSLYAVKGLSEKIRVGCQNMFYEDKGAYTGEISPPMAKELVDYVLIGHSERRQIFKETDQEVNKKIKAALTHRLTPLVCVGETLDEREQGKTIERVGDQVEQALAGLTEEQIEQIVFAYEPVWAIGTGKTALPEQAQEVHAFIRELLKKKIPHPRDTKILYGGSVKPGNTRDLLSQKDIDGALIGGASLKVDPFSAIIQTSAGLCNS